MEKSKWSFQFMEIPSLGTRSLMNDAICVGWIYNSANFFKDGKTVDAVHAISMINGNDATIGSIANNLANNAQTATALDYTDLSSSLMIIIPDIYYDAIWNSSLRASSFYNSAGHEKTFIFATLNR